MDPCIDSSCRLCMQSSVLLLFCFTLLRLAVRSSHSVAGLRAKRAEASGRVRCSVMEASSMHEKAEVLPMHHTASACESEYFGRKVHTQSPPGLIKAQTHSITHTVYSIQHTAAEAPGAIGQAAMAFEY